MPDWLINDLGAIQGGIVKSLAAEIRAGGTATAALAFALGALHALTPGHGKAALAAYFLGREAHIGKGMRIALSAALMHVLSGFAAFLVLRFLIGQAPSLTGRPSVSFTVVGYTLIVAAGALMLIESLRPTHDHHHDGATTLTAGIGLLPCPLTISVLGFAWVQGSAVMIGLVLAALSLGIATTIGAVAVAAIVGRHLLGAVLIDRLPQIERASRLLQGLAGAGIVIIGLFAVLAMAR